MDKFIYIIGRPDPHQSAVTAIIKMGFKAGLLLDKNVHVKNLAPYDKVIRIDFANIDNSLRGLSDHFAKVKGLICTYENYIVAKSKIANFYGLPSLSLATAFCCSDKLLMRQAFAAYDQSITPKFDQINTLEEGLIFTSKYGYPVILKPANLSKSLLVFKCTDDSELRRNYSFMRTRLERLYQKKHIYEASPKIIIEQYMQGKSCSVAAFVDKAGEPHFCQGIAALTTAQDAGFEDSFLYCRSLPAKLDKKQTNKIFATAYKAIKALDMRSSPAHVELIYNDQAVKIIEVGARLGGYRPRMYDLSYGLKLYEQEIALATGHTPNLSSQFRSYSAVFELFPNKVGKFIDIRGYDPATKYAYYSIKAKKGAIIGPAELGHKAAVVVMVSHKNHSEFLRACKSVDDIKVLVK